METTIKEIDFISFVNNSLWNYRKCRVFVLHGIGKDLYSPSGINNIKGNKEDFLKLIKKILPNIELVCFGCEEEVKL